MDERDVEQLLARYRPANPPPSLDEWIGGLTAAPAEHSPRVWPWAAAAAALLAITVALDASTSFGDAPRAPVSDALVQQLGGDAAAVAAARVIDATEQRQLRSTAAPDLWMEAR
jgi:hypothetical protein